MKGRKIRNVQEKHGAYHYVKWNNAKQRNDWTFLCRIEDGESELFAELAKLTKHLPDTLETVFSLYIADQSVEISAATRAKYQQEFEGPLGHRFGHMRPDDVQEADIAQFLEDEKRRGAAVAGNRRRAALSSAFEWAMRNGRAKRNPCRGVRRNRERPSRVYVETPTLTTTYEKANEALKHLLNGGYLSGMRLTDLMALKRSQLTKHGLKWSESKTGRENEMHCKPGLMEVFRRAIAHGDAIASKITKKLPKPRPLPEHVFVNARGKPWTQAALSSAMRRVKAPFAFRQLRAKAQTDSPENVLGHEGQLRARYTRRRKLTSVA